MMEKVETTPQSNLTDRAFKVGLFFKGFDGLLETLGGIMLLIISPEQLNHLARWFTQGELSTDPNDFIAAHILKTAHELTGASLIFGAAYLLSHGVVKLVLVVEVLRNHLWAYRALIGVTAAFVVYQTYRMAVKFSLSMLLLTVFDLVIIYLTAIEYKKHKLRQEIHAKS
jgi:uncharacterized membrane protein